jgi:hypothetical protein
LLWNKNCSNLHRGNTKKLMTILSIIVFIVVVALVVFGATGAIKTITKRHDNPYRVRGEQMPESKNARKERAHA